METRTRRPRLEAPPIIEVMCGFFFPPIPMLDPVVVGGWWNEIKRDYPKHAIQPAVIDAPGVFVAQGSGPLRSWLISEDDAWVLQVQPDRFYVNWRRRREQEYPRFSGDSGVGRRALNELARFRGYCLRELKVEIAPSTVELAKVDLIVEGTHWKDTEDLASVLPIIADVRRFSRTGDVELALNFTEPRDAGQMLVSLSLSTETLPGGAFARAAKIDTRCMMAIRGSTEPEMQMAFAALNEDLNDVFFGLLALDQLSRFDQKGTP